MLEHVLLRSYYMYNSDRPAHRHGTYVAYREPVQGFLQLRPLLSTSGDLPRVFVCHRVTTTTRSRT